MLYPLVAGPEGKTLCQTILSLIVTDIPDQRIFLNADKYWSGNVPSLQYLPQLEVEAQLMIHYCIPYFTHNTREYTPSFVSTGAIVADTDNTWDPVRGCVAGAYGEELEFVAEDGPTISAAIELMTLNKGPDHEISSTTQDLISRHIPTTLQRGLVGDGDDDSISILDIRYTTKSTRSKSSSSVISSLS